MFWENTYVCNIYMFFYIVTILPPLQTMIMQSPSSAIQGKRTVTNVIVLCMQLLILLLWHFWLFLSIFILNNLKSSNTQCYGLVSKMFCCIEFCLCPCFSFLKINEKYIGGTCTQLLLNILYTLHWEHSITSWCF